MKRTHQGVVVAGDAGTVGASSSSSSSSYAASAKAKYVKKEAEDLKLVQDSGDDVLLAALGYKVRSSSMADVAQKLEQLEMAMVIGSGGFSGGFQNGGSTFAGVGPVDNNDCSVLTHLASESVHRNPSDLNSWLENMLSEIHVPTLPLPPSPPPLMVPECDFSTRVSDIDDLTAIIPVDTRKKKRMKPSTTSPTSTAITPQPQPQQMPVVLVEESQATGIRLVHALLSCADAVQKENHPLAESLIKQITLLTTSQGGAMRKVATYFVGALARRIYQIQPPSPPPSPLSPSSDLLEMHFYEACPYLKFAHFTANQAILEAFADKTHVHVIDFGMKQGMQWPALIQALAVRPGGPPFFRLTGIGPPQSNDSDALQEVGWRLAQFAENLHVEFEYRGFVANSLADLEPYMLDAISDSPPPSSSAVAVNSILEFHPLLSTPGSIEKVLETTKALKPAIVTVVEQEANHNGPVFIQRFTEALHYYSSMFDSLEGGLTTTAPTASDGKVATGGGHDQAMAEEYVGKQIRDVVACEGSERKERHETAKQWKERFCAGGLQMAPLGFNAFKQVSMLLELYAGAEGYRIEENDGCLMLCWYTRPLFTTSAWCLP